MDSLAYSPFIHPNNPIKWPRFEELAEKYQYFRDCGKLSDDGKFKINLKEEKCKRELTKALLEHFFGLKINFPEGRLVPALTIRLNYICWLEDLLSVSPEVLGIDIGCGASCIYPLVASSRNGWQFRASEIDEFNHDFARKNIGRNNLEDMITVVKKSKSHIILSDVVEENRTYEFCMCNPPFHDEHTDGINLLKAAPVETMTVGGEVGFIKQIMKESLTLKKRVKLYTSMIGKKLSVLPLMKFLEENLSKSEHDGLIFGYGITQFCQGRVIRWGLVWTYSKKKFSGHQKPWDERSNLTIPWGRVTLVKYAFNCK